MTAFDPKPTFRTTERRPIRNKLHIRQWGSQHCDYCKFQASCHDDDGSHECSEVFQGGWS
jgi:hypothetical protein